MSGYIGTVPDPTDVAAPGVWSINDVASGEAESLWPTNESYVHIARTFAGAGATSLVLNNIPANFTDLMLCGTFTFQAGAFGGSQPGDLFLQLNYTTPGIAYNFLRFSQDQAGVISNRASGSPNTIQLNNLPLAIDSLVAVTINIHDYRSGTPSINISGEVNVTDVSNSTTEVNIISACAEVSALSSIQIYSDYLLFASNYSITNTVDLYGTRRVTP